MEPELEKGMYANPRGHRVTRIMRLLLFSFVSSALLVSLLIVVIRFVWDDILAPWLKRDPYEPRIEFILPSIVLIALLLAKLIWDAAEGRGPTPRKPKRA